MRSLHPFFLLVFSVFCGFSSSASVFNDTPCSADNMGILDTATSCPFSSGGVPLTRFSQSNINATAELLQPALMNCQNSLADMPVQSKDLWYKFVMRGHNLNVILVGSINTPFIALYQYTGNCMSMVPVDCAKGTAGYINTDFKQLVPGMEYYLQVTGGNLTDAGTFNLVLSNSNNCLSCTKDELLFVDHAPVNGFYNTGDTVNFCFVVNGFKHLNNNSLHGIVPVLGPGWSPSIIYYPVQRTSSAPGNWLSGYTYNNLPVIGTQKGFFFDGPVSNNVAQDNLGDPGGPNDRWVFCWQAIANTCPSAIDMNITIYDFSDGETGTGPQPGCIADNRYHFAAKLNCCGSAEMHHISTTCGTTCNGVAELNIFPSSTFLPLYYYAWFDHLGNVLPDNIPSVPQYSDTLTGLCPGDYSVVVANTAQNCFVAKGFEVKTPFTIDAQQQTFSCQQTVFVTATVNAQPNTNVYSYSWSNGNTNQTATNLFSGGTYVVYVTANSCTLTDTIKMEVLPPSDPFFTYPSTNITKCTGSPPFVFPMYIATPGGTFTCGTPGVVNSVTGAIDMSNVIVSNSYQITYVSPPPCSGTYIVTVTIVGQDLSYFHYPTHIVCETKYDNVVPDSVAQYGGVFSSSPAGLNIDSISGIIYPPYLPGNYIITYNSPNQGACHSVDTVAFSVHAVPATPQGPSSGYTYCPGDPTITMTVTQNPSCSCLITWASDINFTNILAIGPSTYTANTNQQSPLYFYVVAYDPQSGCYSQGSVIAVTMAAYPNVLSSSSDTVICPGFDGYLHATHDPNFQYSWDPPTGLNDPTSPDPMFNITSTTTYQVFATDLTTGCQGNCVITITVDSTRGCDTLIIYHGLTPNGDFHNDTWIIDGISKFPKNRVSIFTRWGEKVWDANDYNNRTIVWDGRNQKGNPLVAGTYYYIVEVPDKPAQKGWVELSR